MYDIKKRRLELGLTLEEVGDIVGVGKSTVRKWESGMIDNMKRDKIALLAKALKINPLNLIVESYRESKLDIQPIYNQLEPPRQKKVYNLAEYELEEQNKVPNNIIYIQSALSAGTGIVDLDPDHVEEMEYKGKVPKHDMAFLVSGDSMSPFFMDGEVVFVEKTPDIRSGQIIAVQINEEAFIKKAYIEEDKLRLVSLNKEYDDIFADGNDDIRIVGKVIL